MTDPKLNDFSMILSFLQISRTFMKFNDFPIILKQIWISMIFQELWKPCCSLVLSHELSISPWWRHQMETFSVLLALWEGDPPVPWSFDIYIFICAWTNDCANYPDAGNLRRHRAQSDVTVMIALILSRKMQWTETCLVLYQEFSVIKRISGF